MNTAWIVSLALLAAGEPGKSVKPVPTPSAPGQDVWQLTLPEAIRIGVKNSEVIRVVEDRGTIRIAPREGPAMSPRLAAELMAHVRSIEQQYWALVQQEVQVWAREMAVKLCEEVEARERADLGHSNTADQAEARQSLERCRLALVAATSDRVTTERQLRNILGLPPADNQRIVPVTAPVEAKVEPDWETCLAAMLKEQPDILQQREVVAEAEKRAARADSKSSAPVGLPSEVADAFEAQQGRAAVDRQREFLKQVIHRTTHTLARFLLEIDANHKQFQTARKLRESAQVRLDRARAYYKEGKADFSVDRLLDAISQHSDAVAQEAQYKCSYNTSIAALEEAKGTLLAERKILIVARPREAAAKAAGVALTPRLVESPRTDVFGIDLDVKPAAFAPPADATSGPVAPRADSPAPSGRVIRYDIALEGGPVPVQLKGTVSFGTPGGR
ncbi:MAG TPA: TolC family protein [Isosphaeraceae bacterium]